MIAGYNIKSIIFVKQIKIINKMKYLQRLKDYANAKDDWYLKRELDLIEAGISIDIINAQMQAYQEMNNKLKTI